VLHYHLLLELSAIGPQAFNAAMNVPTLDSRTVLWTTVVPLVFPYLYPSTPVLVNTIFGKGEFWSSASMPDCLGDLLPVMALATSFKLPLVKCSYPLYIVLSNQLQGLTIFFFQFLLMPSTSKPASGDQGCALTIPERPLPKFCRCK
jgi:hypothetical protein